MPTTSLRVEVLSTRSGWGWRVLAGGRVVAVGTAPSGDAARERAADAVLRERARAFAAAVLGRGR